MTASVLSFAPRFASTSARAAAPSRARRTGSVTSAEHRLLELALGLHLDGRVVGQERVGDLLEVLHVRAEHDRLAEDRRLEDVVAAVIDEAAADEDRGRQLIELRQLADRVEHDDVGARLGVDRQLGSPHGGEAGVARQPLDLAEPLGLPRRQDRAARRATVVLMRANARSTAASSPRTVLPATTTTRFGGQAEEPQHPLARLAVRHAASASRSESNFRLPVTVTRAGSAPRSISRRADSSLCMQKRSTSASTRRKNGRISR